MFARIITLAVCTLISSVAFAQTPATSNPPANRCAVAKSATVEHTADGRLIIRTKEIKVCK